VRGKHYKGKPSRASLRTISVKEASNSIPGVGAVGGNGEDCLLVR